MIDVVWVTIPAGSFMMGSVAFYPEEAPIVKKNVASFLISPTPVTNEDFMEFVDDTGYLTTAERPFIVDGHTKDPGSLVFTPTEGPVDLRDWRQWWTWIPGTSWRAPEGPGSDILDRLTHPVVHVSHDDALAYCAWKGVRLPHETEWEYAARGGLEGATFAWGEEAQDVENLRANTWQGRFPYENLGTLGWERTSPVGSFPPNGYGLLDVTGNVWEWTASPWTPRHAENECSCSPGKKLSNEDSELLVVKGGSFLCSPEYCLRYRPAARSSQSRDTSTSHLGFRVAKDKDGPSNSQPMVVSEF